MGYNARDDEIRAHAPPVGSAAGRAGHRAPLQRAFIGQRLFFVLAEDRRSAQVEAPLACHQLRQLRDRGRSGFAREVPQPGGFHPRCVARRALPPLQRTWPPAHRRAGAECIAVVH